MSFVVVDTDVVSFLFKKDSRAELYRPHLEGQVPVMSFMTLAELLRWALIRKWGKKRQAKLYAHLRKFAVYPFDAALCQTWAEVTTCAEGNGRPIETADAWIAATALHHGIPLVTHNGGDYAGVEGLVIISEGAQKAD